MTWTEPTLVAEVEFSEWTDDNLLRHPSFQGLREDKDPQEVVKEQPPISPSRKASRKSQMAEQKINVSNRGGEAASVAGVTLSHPDRVLYPEQGATKLEVAEYYESIADWILPHVVDRPLTLVRCPQGRAKKCFFQKHWTESLPKAIESVLIQEKDSQEPYVVIQDLPGLISLVQMSALELHPWGARVDRLERPDQMVFDLDPGEGVDFARINQAAIEVRDLLAQTELQSFVRTSGGKGLHVVVPITRRNSWEDVGDFAHKIARGLAKQSPTRYVAKMRKALRKDRIFIDYLRNQRGATSIASYSTRARAGAPVATPLDWQELSQLPAVDHWTIANVPERLQSLSVDPWAGFDIPRQSITQAAEQFAGSL